MVIRFVPNQVEPDDEDMVMLHIIPAADCRREKGVYTKDKLNLYLKNVVELEGVHFKVCDLVRCACLSDLPFSSNLTCYVRRPCTIKRIMYKFHSLHS